MNKWEEELNHLSTELDYHEAGCDHCSGSHKQLLLCEDRRSLVFQFNFALFQWLKHDKVVSIGEV